MGFYGQCFFCGFCEFLRPVLFLLILLILYIAKVAYDYMVWVLIRKCMVWPFVLQFSSFPFRFRFVSLLLGALVNEVWFEDLEALIYFLQCTSFGGVDLFDPEAF